MASNRNLPSGVIFNCSFFNHFKYGIHHMDVAYFSITNFCSILHCS
jgi:hypothetical protein